jgi:hypothetical protein
MDKLYGAPEIQRGRKIRLRGIIGVRLGNVSLRHDFPPFVNFVLGNFSASAKVDQS